jgi:hypothetical protein
MKLRLHLQAMQAKVDAANDKVATLERRLEEAVKAMEVASGDLHCYCNAQEHGYHYPHCVALSKAIHKLNSARGTCDKVATLERRLAVESGLLDEVIAERDNMSALIRRIAAYKKSTVRDRLIQDAVDYLVRTNNYGSLTREMGVAEIP